MKEDYEKKLKKGDYKDEKKKSWKESVEEYKGELKKGDNKEE